MISLYKLPIKSSPARSSPLTATQYFRDWTSIRYGLMWAYEGPVHPSGKTGRWTHPSPSCWLIRKGRVEVRTGKHVVTAGPGQWVFVAVPARTQTFSDDAEILSLHFHFTWPGGEPVIEQPRTAVFSAKEQPQLEKAARPLARLVQNHFPRASAFLPDERCTLPLYLRVQNMLPRWLSAYLEAQAWLGVYPRRLDALDERVLTALTELDRQPLDQKFSEPALVGRIGIGRSQLNALFLKATGSTPRRYHERRRLEAAERLLADTRMSIKEIALDLGFGSESHFSHWFRHRKNTTPSLHRTAPSVPGTKK